MSDHTRTEMYFLYSTKMNGWQTSGGAYIDDIALAGAYSIDITVQRVRAHYDKYTQQFILIPVRADILALRP